MDITRENLLKQVKDGMEALGLSIAGLERDSGVPKDTVRDFLRGKTQILRADKLQKILRVLNPSEKCAVTYAAMENAEIRALPKNSVQDVVDYPPGLGAGDVVALRVETDAMTPVFHKGWVIYYTPHNAAPAPGGKGWQVPYNATASQEPHAAFLGKPCVAKLEDGRLFLRTLKAGGSAGKFSLIAYNAPDIKDVAVSAVYKIVFIKTL